MQEFDRQIYLDAHGAPKVRLGFRETNHFRKRLGSFETLRSEEGRRVGEELRTDLAKLGKSLFLASNTVSIVGSTGEDDDDEEEKNSSSTGKSDRKNSRNMMASFAVMPDGTPIVGCSGWLYKKGMYLSLSPSSPSLSLTHTHTDLRYTSGKMEKTMVRTETERSSRVLRQERTLET